MLQVGDHAGARRSTPRRARGPARRRRCSSIANCRFERCSVRRAEAALELRDVVDADRAAGRRRHGQLADRRRCRAAGSRARGSSPDTARRAFAVARDLVVAGHHQAQRVADGRHPHAEVGRARAIDRDVDLRVRRCCSRSSRRRGSAVFCACVEQPAASSRTACRGRGRAGWPGSRSRRRLRRRRAALRARDDRAGSPDACARIRAHLARSPAPA